MAMSGMRVFLLAKPSVAAGQGGVMDGEAEARVAAEFSFCDGIFSMQCGHFHWSSGLGGLWTGREPEPVEVCVDSSSGRFRVRVLTSDSFFEETSAALAVLPTGIAIQNSDEATPGVLTCLRLGPAPLGFKGEPGEPAVAAGGGDALPGGGVAEGEFPQADGERDTVAMRTRTVLKGDGLTFQGGVMHMRTSYGEIRVPVANVAAISFPRSAMDASPSSHGGRAEAPPRHRVELWDGAAYILTSLALDGLSFTGVDTLGFPCRIPVSAVSAVKRIGAPRR